MAGFKLNHFSGLRPRVPESLLAPTDATVAENCDFAYGELRNTKNGWAFIPELANVARSLYTENGILFFSWPEANINAVRSPLANDTFGRLYYTDSEGLKVAYRDEMKTNGGLPVNTCRAGVPRPTAAPVLGCMEPERLQAKCTWGKSPPPEFQETGDIWAGVWLGGGTRYYTLNIHPGQRTGSAAEVNVKFETHWEYGGVKYQVREALPTQASDSKLRFSFLPKGEKTPKSAFPVVHITAHWGDGEQIFDLYSSNSSFSKNGGLYDLEMSEDESEEGKESEEQGGTLIKTEKVCVTLTQSLKEADKESRAYVYTYVNAWNEEGPPSPPAVVTTSPIANVSVTVTRDANSDIKDIKEVRIYRTGPMVADFFYVGSIGVASGPGSFTFTDNIRGEMLNEALSSHESYPPVPGLTGLMQLPNGILCAFKGNELHFSEAYKPWAWPPAYVKTLPANIIGGVVHGSGAVITTATQPHLISGVSPDSMTVSKINVDQAGVSPRSIAVVNGVVMYASNDGLVTLNGATASLMQGQRFFTREVWRKRCGAGLSSMEFAVWDGRLIVYSSEAKFTPFMIRFDEADGTMTDLPELVAQCSFVSALSDQMYTVRGTTRYQFNGGTSQSAVWESAEQVFPRPLNFGVGQALVEGEWTLEIWAYVKRRDTGAFEYQLKHSENLTSGLKNFRLPGGFEADRYRFRIVGKGRFRELRIAQTFRELATL